MENNPEQVFYIQYDKTSGYVIGQISEKGYIQLNDGQKRNYTQVLVPLEYLYGWGRWWNTVRYVNEALKFPNNWPKDQSKEINDLSTQLQEMQTELSTLINSRRQSQSVRDNAPSQSK